MKNLVFNICIAALTTLAAGSCAGGRAGQNGSASDSITFDTVRMDTTVWLVPEDTAGPRAHLDLAIARPHGPGAEALTDSLVAAGLFCTDWLPENGVKGDIAVVADTFATRYFRQYIADYSELYRMEKRYGMAYYNEYVVRTELDTSTDAYISYLATIYIYNGGAHGSTIFIAKNIDRKNGHVVTLKDLFVPGYEHTLTQLIVNAICKKFEVANLEQLRQKTVFDGMEPYPADNFIIGKDKVTFIYSPDEIACHALSDIRVEITAEELKPIAKRQ